MANYYGFARSNYFRVKNLEKFKKVMERCSVELVHPERRVQHDDGTSTYERNEKLVALLSTTEDGWSRWWDGDCDRELDIPSEVAKHLKSGEVAVFQEIGYEKLRYLTGFSEAINSRGERIIVSIDDVYEKAKKLGKHITRATY